MLIVFVGKERDASSLQRVDPRNTHRSRQKPLKGLIFLLFFSTPQVVRVWNHVDSCDDRPAQWAVLIVLEPGLDTFLVEEVFLRVAWHSYDGSTIDDKYLTADEALLE